MGTHTYATLDVSSEAYQEIKDKLRKAGYDHVFMEDGAIDMHGIGLVSSYEPTKENVVAHFNKELNKKLEEGIDRLAMEHGMTQEELMQNVHKFLEEAHKNREAQRIKNHGLKSTHDE